MQRELTHETFSIAATLSEQKSRTKKTKKMKKMRVRKQLAKQGVAVFSSRLCD